MSPAYEAGRKVLGPIVARFVRDLRLHAAAAGTEDEVVLLFCARGGLRMRLAYETAASALDIGTGGRAADLMVSRLMATKAALGRVPLAFDQFLHEAAGLTLGEAVALLLPPRLRLLSGSEAFSRPYTDRAQIENLLLSESPCGDAASMEEVVAEAIRTELAFQRGAFEEHLLEACGGRTKVVLIDTGLFGGTMQLLEGFRPDLSWSCALFGRANYRGVDAPHFARTAGLVFEAERPVAHVPESALLRHWHLVEGMFEPPLASVERFDRDPAGRPVSNLETPGWRSAVEPAGDDLFTGIMDHLSSLTPRDLVRIDAQAVTAARELARMILRPGVEDVEAFDLAPRSRDFGRDGASPVLRPTEGLSTLRRVWSVRHSLWREGQIRRAAPMPALALRLFATGRRISDVAPACKRIARRAMRLSGRLADAANEGMARRSRMHVVNPRSSH